MSNCKDWGDLKKAKVLVIGHDPRLQHSDTIAEYCLFANYYFKQNIRNESEKRKRDLANSTFQQIMYLTNNKFNIEEIYLTNLCNEELPHAPLKKTVYIPEDKARNGIEKNI